MQAETTFTDQEHRTLSSKRCNDDEKQLKIDLSTDAYGFENSWRLLKNTANGPKELYSGPPGKGTHIIVIFHNVSTSNS